MLINLKKTPYGVTCFKTRFIFIKKIHSTSFFKALQTKFKNFFKKKKFTFDPLNNKNYDEIEDRFKVYPPEDIMAMYYLDYWEHWENSRDENFNFKNFNEKVIRHHPITAEGLEYHYPFEMFASEEGLDKFDFDAVHTDPFSKEELDLPLTTLRWNYYRVSYYEGLNQDMSAINQLLTDSWHFTQDLERMDLIDAILATAYDPKYRNTPLYEDYLKLAKIRYRLLYNMYIDNNRFGNTTLLIIPWFFSWIVGDLLCDELNNAEIVFFDIQSIFLYLFWGKELTWKYEATYSERRYKFYRLYKTSFSTLKKDFLKIKRLINLKNIEPKVYNKLKQYYKLTFERKIYLTLIGLRAKAVREKQSYKISLFNSAALIRFFIWCYKKLMESISIFFENVKSFFINLIPNIFIFLKNLPFKIYTFYQKQYKMLKAMSTAEMYNNLKKMGKELEKKFQRFKDFYFKD